MINSPYSINNRIKNDYVRSKIEKLRNYVYKASCQCLIDVEEILDLDYDEISYKENNEDPKKKLRRLDVLKKTESVSINKKMIADFLTKK